MTSSLKTLAIPAVVALLGLCGCPQSIPLSPEPDAGEACTDECAAGAKTCDGTTGLRTCGQFDADRCREWKTTACAAGETCVDSACVPSCTDGCAAGSKVCLGAATVQTCGNYDSDPCLELGGDTACEAGQHCEQGACVPDGTACTDECVLGVAVCEGEAVRTCGQYDADPCADLSTPSACDVGETCNLGLCIPTCQDACPALAEVACEGNGLKTCALSATGCLAWSAPAACPAGETCSGKACAATCSDDCATPGDTCSADSAAVVSCGEFDDDPCLDLKAPRACGAGFTCRSGQCVATCSDECALAQKRCGADGKSVETCGNYDADPCLEYGGAAQCSGGAACTGGACASACADDCTAGQVQCVTGQAAFRTCGQFDADACLDWSTPTLCQGWQACSAGACVLGPAPGTLLINEVVYDSYSPSADGATGTEVFLELWGTPHLPLDGFSVVAVNGNGGTDYATLNLDGATVGADGFFLIAHPSGDPAIVALAQITDALVDFQNGPDSLQVRWHGQVVDALAYGTFTAADVSKGEGRAAPGSGAGKSLSRDVNHKDTNDNLADFAVATPTPRANLATCTATCPALDQTECVGTQVRTCADPDGDGCGDWSVAADCPTGQRCSGAACAAFNPCSPNPCGEANKTVCSANGAAATCSCDAGFVADGSGACVRVDPCSPNPCSAAHRAQCQAVGGVAVCGCDPGYGDDGAGACVRVDPCTPNPCTAAHQGACTATGPTTAVCSCDPGYVPSGTACVLEQTSSCGNSHAGDSFESDECPADAKLATLPASQTRTFSPAGDVDWIAIDGTAAHIYVVTATSSGSPAPVPGVLLYAADGTTVLQQSTPTAGTTATVRAKLGAGRFYVKVRASSTTATGSYTLTITNDGADDHSDVMAGATALAASSAGASAGGVFQFVGDVDTFAVPVTAGRIYRVEEISSTDVFFKVFTAGSIMVDWRDGPESHTFKAAASDTVYVAVKAYSGTGQSFTVKATDLGLDDHGDDMATATVLASSAAGTSIDGVFQFPGDAEVFSVQVTAGRIYKLEETSATDVWFRVFSATGDLVAWRDGPESYAWRPTASGTVYLAVQQYSGFGGSFTVKATDAGLDDHGDDAATATALAPTAAGATATGVFQFTGDVDVFAVPVIAGRIYRVEETSTTDVWFKVTNAAATLVAWQDGPESYTFLAAASETVYVWVQQYSGYGSSLAVKATDLGTDDHGGDMATATALAMGGQATGVFQYPGDVEAFAVPVVAGHIYRLEETSATDVWFRVTAAAGDLVAWQDGPESYVFESATAQTVYVLVQSYSGFGSSFTVKATDLGVDDHGDTAADATLVALGSTTAGNAQYPADWDWLKVPVTAGNIYRFAETAPADVWVRLVDAKGADVVYQDSPESVTWKAGASGTAAFGVRPYSSSTISAPWSIEIADLGTDDVGDDKATATALTIGTAANGNIQFPADEDWFKFTVTASDTFAFQALTTGLATSVTIYPSGSATALASGSGASGVTFSVPGAGDYYVRVKSYSSGAMGAYTVLVRN
ncbi:MAG TPA: PPC domain-containing protein [Myxococcales bacterium]